MAKVSPELNPQPEPPIFALAVIAGAGTQTNTRDTIEILTPGGVIEVNLKNHTVTMKHPEMGIPGGWAAAKALGVAITTWQNCQNVKGLEELHAHAEKMLACAAEAVVKATAHK